ncbi:MAG: hypothetical protein NT007_02720 [Candidatus Kapabacteria bacterium]|nr:hypothetical protein [Candidatus Kapabacteria bacterium]
MMQGTSESRMKRINGLDGFNPFQNPFNPLIRLIRDSDKGNMAWMMARFGLWVVRRDYHIKYFNKLYV